jgi:NhaA family Na+:H+ antiporter
MQTHAPATHKVKPLRDFFRLEAAGGLLLMMAAVLALVVANSPLGVYYKALLDLPLEVRIGTFGIAKPLLLWINDGLMAVFFLLVGMELKREVVEGARVRRRRWNAGARDPLRGVQLG